MYNYNKINQHEVIAMIKASIIGATGYAGIELIRMLNAHPNVNVLHMVSQTYVGKPISEVYPNFSGISDNTFIDMETAEIARQSDVVFVSLPHGVSAETVKKLRQEKCKVIDLSGDFRYKSVLKYEQWYNAKHPYPEMLTESVYGLPELHRDSIKTANLVANPGCYTTCSILGLAPLVSSKVIDPDSIIIDAKSGATGAGRGVSLALHFCEVNENIKAYGVATHRHTSEIEQELSILAGYEISLSFTPHLLPTKRGILCTIYANLKTSVSHEDVYDVYCNLYSDEPFVHVYKEGVLPEVKFVNGSNRCHIGFVIDKRLNRIVIVSAIDNLIKGAGGQAIQNMNIMFGFDETTALTQAGWYL
jgi:N-acetyl-gamma-glutamyl-phosphate reductase